MAEIYKKLEKFLGSLIPISGLPRNYQDELLNKAAVLEFRKGTYIFREGEVDDYSYYLLTGKLDMYAKNQLAKQVTAGTETASYALAQLQPRQLSAKTRTSVSVLRVNRTLLDRLLTLSSVRSPDETLEVTEISEIGPSNWMTRVLQLELFQNIPATNIQQILTHLECFEVKTGDVIVEQESPGDFYYIIDQGHCQVTRHLPDDNGDIQLAVLAEGATFGEEALVSGTKRNATVSMLTNGRLLRLTKEDFIDLIKKPLLHKVAFADAEKMVRQGATWLDVRLAEERGNYSLPGSIAIPLNLLRARLSELDLKSRFITYCDTGSRSSVAAFLLQQHGFDVYYLAGGLIRSPRVPSRGPAEQRKVAKTRRKETEKKDPIAEPASQFDEGALQASIRASSLNAELTKADLQLQEAKRLKMEAEKAKCSIDSEIERRLREEREKLREEAEHARKALEETQRFQAELLAEKMDIEAKAASIAHREKETEKRLKKREKQLALQNTQELEALKKIQQRRDHSAKGSKKQQKLLVEEAVQTNSLLKAAKQAKKKVALARNAAEKEAKTLRQAEQQRVETLAKEEEKRLRKSEEQLASEYQRITDELGLRGDERKTPDGPAGQTKEEPGPSTEDLDRYPQEVVARIFQEKHRLENEFSKSIGEVEKARWELEADDAARVAVEEESERITAEYKAVSTRRQEETEEEFKAELDEETRKIEQALEEAHRAKREAIEAQRVADENVVQFRARRKGGPPLTVEMISMIEKLEENIFEVHERLEEAELALKAAEAAKSKHGNKRVKKLEKMLSQTDKATNKKDDKRKRKRDLGNTQRLQQVAINTRRSLEDTNKVLDTDLSVWRVEQREKEKIQEEETKEIREILKQAEERVSKEKKLEKKATDEMFDEIQAQLNNDEE